MVGDSVDTKKNSKRLEANDVIRRVMQNQSELHPDGFKEKEGPLHRQGCGVTLFFSFDIVNSTDYKQKDTLLWPKRINGILEFIKKNVNVLLPGSAIWRILGDEIIFIIPVQNLEVLYGMILAIRKILVQTIDEIHSWDSYRILSLKAVAWIAFITDNVDEDDSNNVNTVAQQSGESKWYNYSLIYHIDSIHGRYISEFIGNDIDCGFRLRDYSVKGMLFVSFELAFLINKEILKSSNSNNSGEENQNVCLQILGFRKLKGIWNNRPYPIIWCSSAKNNEGLLSDITYDLFETNRLISEFKSNLNGNGIHPSCYFKDVNKALEKICADMGLDDKIEFLIKQMNTKELQIASDLLRDDDLLQFHLVAVCCDVEQEKVLVIKRSSTRSILPGYWEFGCAKVQKDKTIEESIQEKYAKDFLNLKFHIQKSKTRIDSPVPYALFEIPNSSGTKEYKSDKGVIIMAKVDNAKGISLNNAKHSEIHWIGKEDVDKFCQEESRFLVSDFENTIKAAFKFIEVEKGKINGQ